jgi:hypothetical protein
MHGHGMEDTLGWLRWGWERIATSPGQGCVASDARLMCRLGLRGGDDHLGLETAQLSWLEQRTARCTRTAVRCRAVRCRVTHLVLVFGETGLHHVELGYQLVPRHFGFHDGMTGPKAPLLAAFLLESEMQGGLLSVSAGSSATPSSHETI